MSDFFLTANVGQNADVLPQILRQHISPGAQIADVTYGKGVMWKHVPPDMYQVYPSDIKPRIPGCICADLRRLPYKDISMDAVVLDPPYMHDASTSHKSLRSQYGPGAVNLSHAGIIRLYAGGILEGWRILKPKGIFIVKCQDEIESSKQQWSHIEIMDLFELFGFNLLDLLMVVQAAKPMLQRKQTRHARKNHSYFVVAQKRGLR